MKPVNPVLRRELVERWRSRRAPITLSCYLAVLGGILYLLYRVGTAVLNAQFGFGVDASTAGPALGRFLVEGLFFFVLLLVLFVGPGYAAAQISGERERRTLSLLQVTLLRPFHIVVGKLGASVAWLTLLVVAAVPLGAVAFFLGGVALTDLLRGGLMLVVIALSVAGMGLGISSLTRRTTGSIVLTYGLVLSLVLGTLFLAGVEAVMRGVRGEQVRTPVALYLNPFFGLADAINAARPSSLGMAALPSPLGLMAEALPGSPFVGGGFGGPMPVEEQVFIEGDMGHGMAVGEVEVAVPEAVPGPVPPDVPVEVPPDVPVEVPPDVSVELAEEVPFDEPVMDPAGPPAFPVRPGDDERRPVWLIVMGLYLVMGGAGVAVATRRLRRTEPRTRAMGSSGRRRNGSVPLPAAAAPAAEPPPGDVGWERSP